jgi:hypothetical protein
LFAEIEETCTRSIIIIISLSLSVVKLSFKAMLGHWEIVWISLLFLDLSAVEYNLQQTRNIDGSDSYYHCLYYTVLDQTKLEYGLKKDFRHAYLLIPYCIRPYQRDENTAIIRGSIANEITLHDLREWNTSIDDLFRWSAPMDLVEDYQHYLDTHDSNLALMPFNNCSSDWFGPLCQY